MWEHKRVMNKQGYKENNQKYKTRKTQNPRLRTAGPKHKSTGRLFRYSYKLTSMFFL